jgi:outer membrane protein
MRGFAFGVGLACLASAAIHAQTPASQPPATGQKPAAPTQPAAPAPAPAAPAPAPAPRPFPEGAKIAYVVLQRIASESADGKTAAAQIQALQQKKSNELNEKTKELQTIQQRLEKEASVISATAQADLQKKAERLDTEIQRFTQDAQKELQELQTQLQQQFEQKITPVLALVGQEKGLHYIFNAQDSGLVWAEPGLDITADVIKRLDAGKSAPPAAKPPVQ